MALTRVHTWVVGEVLTAADLNSEFNNILANANSLLFPSTGTMNFNNQQALSFKLENLAADPAVGNAGRAYWNTSTQQLRVDTGTAWVNVGPSSGGTGGTGSATPFMRVRGLQAVLPSNIATISANEYDIITTGSTAGGSIFSTASFTVNCQTAGPVAGGRDTALAFASTFVRYYVIATGVGSTTLAGMVSTKLPTVGPTLPTSYSAYAYLFTVPYTSGSSAVLGSTNTGTVVRGSWVYNNLHPYTAVSSLTTGPTITPDPTNVSTQVPIEAQQISLQARYGASSSAGVASSQAEVNFHVILTSSAIFTTANAFFDAYSLTVGAAGAAAPLPPYNTVPLIVPNVNTTPTLYSGIEYISGATAGYAIKFRVMGYQVANGDA